MNQSEILVSICLGAASILLTGVLSIIGWVVSRGITSMNMRLERLETKLNEIVTQVNVSVARQDVNTVEIDKLRNTVHEIRSDVSALSAVQERCRHCSPTT